MRFFTLIVPAVLCCLLAATGSAIVSGEDSFRNLRFHLNLFDWQREAQEIAETITLYNKSTARYYSSVGEPDLVNAIPASQILKRSLVADVTMLQRMSRAVVFDRDSEKVEKIEFLAWDAAVVETSEVWAMALQESHSRQPLTTVKAQEVRVRYLLHKEPFGEVPFMWVVHQADVYPKDEEIPNIVRKPVL